MTKTQEFFKAMYEQGRLVLVDGKMKLLVSPIQPGHDASILSTHNRVASR